MSKPKFFKNFLIVKDCALCLMFLIAAAFPLGSMGGVKVETSYKIIKLFFGDIINKGVNAEYNASLFIGAIGFVFGALFSLPLLKSYNSHFKTAGLIIRLSATVSFSVFFIIAANYGFKFYGLTSNTFIPVMIVYAVVEILSLFIEYFVFRNLKDEEDEEDEEWAIAAQAKEGAIAVETQEGIKAAQVEKTEKPAAEPVGYKRKFSLNRLFDGLSEMFCALLPLFFCLYFCPTKINNAANYWGSKCEIVFKKVLDESFLGVEGVDDEYCKNFILNFQEGSIHVLTYKSNNYNYWQKKLKEKQAEIKELTPDSDNENGIKAYAEKIKKLREDISVIEKNLKTLNYENIKVTTVARSEKNGIVTDLYADITEILYDAQYNGDSSAIKWNNKDNKRVFCNQSIKLSETEFSPSTDFSSVKIGATVNYYDGSFKISYITPENYQELNNASSGEHKLKWSDSWGSYEYKIKIK